MRQALLIYLLFFGLSSASAQDNLMITYSTEQTAISNILEDLEKQYGIRFSYSTDSWIDSSKDVSFNEDPIEDVLDYLLQDQHMEYRVIENNILIRKSNSYAEIATQRYDQSLHISGKITASSSNVELPYATVAIENSSVGTYTDDSGLFDLEIPENLKHEYITLSFIGFEPLRYKISELEDEFLMVTMDESPFSVEEITIVNREKPIRINSYNAALNLNGNQILNKASGIFGSDVNRNIQLLPGVTAHDDDDASIKIRGGNSDETMTILDGMPLYSPSHSFGIFSSINSNYIDSVNVFKNSYPIHYGGKTSGLVEMHSSSEIPEKVKPEVNINLMTASVDLSIPLTEKSALLLAGRSTIREISNRQFNTFSNSDSEAFLIQNFGNKVKNRRNNPEFSFHDINAKFFWTPSNYSRISVNFFNSRDDLDNDYMYRVNDDKENEVNLNIREDNKWSTYASSLIWESSLRPSILWTTRFHYSNFEKRETDIIAVGKKLKNQNTGPPPVQNPNGVLINSKLDNNLSDKGIDSHLTLNQRNNTWTLGLVGQSQILDYNFSENNISQIFGSEEVATASAYTSYLYKLKNRFQLEIGIKASRYSNINRTYITPQLFALLELNKALSIKASYANYQQVVRQFYYEYRGVPMELWVAAGQNDIPVLESKNFMLGGTLRIGNLTLDIEGFSKVLDGTVEYAVLNPNSAQNNPDEARDYRLFSGDGRVYGVDFILGTNFGKYETFVSYTLSKNEERYKEILRNQFYASENDRRHQLKWVNTYHTSRWNFGINGIYSSGRPYTDFEGFQDAQDIRDAEMRFKRLPAYIRFDLSTGYTFETGGKNIEVGFSLFNILNTQNVKYVQSVTTQVIAGNQPVNTVLGNESALLNRTFNLNLSLQF